MVAPAAFYCLLNSQTGFRPPHWPQKFPLFTAPQLGQVQLGLASGFRLPHWPQKFPLFTVPQLGQVQPAATPWGWPKPATGAA